MEHFGKWLEEKRKSLRMYRQQDLAVRASLSLKTINNLENSGSIEKMRPLSLKALADALLVSVSQLKAAAEQYGDESASRKRRKSRSRIEPPLGVNDGAIQSVHQIPVWDIDVAAGRWVQVPIAELDYEDPEQRQVIDSGRFRLRVVGDCMEPDYEHLSTVEFEIVRIDLDGYIVGSDYVICRSDGTATFKRVADVDDDSVHLAAINQRKYPGSFSVPRQEIGRVARVAWKLVPPPPARPLKIRV